MPYKPSFRLRGILAIGALATAFVIPSLASAQFEANKLYGKTFNEVSKMFGKPAETAGSPINYSRFKTAGAVDTIVWYFWNTGKVEKVQIIIAAKPGESAADADAVLKRYKLSVGANARNDVGTKLPSMSKTSVGKVAGMPWTKVFISYKVAQHFKPETMKYCKEHKLDPTNTFFWTIQLTNKKPASRVMGIGG